MSIPSGSTVVSVSVPPQGATTPVATEEKYRRQMRSQLYGVTRNPVIPAPDLIEQNYAVAYPYNSYTVVSPNLLRIDRITHHIDTDIVVYAYLYVNTSSSKYCAITHEGHDYFNLPNHHYHIQRLLHLGWNVVIVQMPQIFAQPSPPNAPDPAGEIDHGAFGYPREAVDPGYLRTFLAPTLYVKQALKTTYGFSTFAMIGISGGGWTTLMVAALDTEIRAAFSVAGSGTYDIFPLGAPVRDYEQEALPESISLPTRPCYAFLPQDYRDLYAMAGDNNRFMRLVYIDGDLFWPSAGKHALIDAVAAAADARVNGTVAVSYDTSQSVHEISNFTGDLICSDLFSRGLIATGPVGVVADPILINPIAWYRGEGMQVGQMTDRTGNGNHAVQAVAANQAALYYDPYVKQNALLFSPGGGGDDFYTVPAVKVGGSNPPAYTEYSMLIVAKVNAGIGNYMYMDATTAGGIVRTGPLLYSSPTNNGQAGFGINSDAIGAAASTEWIWIVGTHVAGQRQIWVNGVLKATQVGADSSLAMTRLGIGRSIDPSPFWPLQGAITEGMLLGHAFTPAEITGMLAPYIHARYGL